MSVADSDESVFVCYAGVGAGCSAESGVASAEAGD